MAPGGLPRRERVDGRADLYSLGATWYQLISSRTPFLAENTPAMLRAQVDDAPPRLGPAGAGACPRRWSSWCTACWRSAASDRLGARGHPGRADAGGLRQLGLDFPETVVLPPQGGLAPDPTTAATHVVPGGERGAAGAATATADLIRGARVLARGAADAGQAWDAKESAHHRRHRGRRRIARAAREDARGRVAHRLPALALAAIAAISIAAARRASDAGARARRHRAVLLADGHARRCHRGHRAGAGALPG